jgi:hypothetical protein
MVAVFTVDNFGRKVLYARGTSRDLICGSAAAICGNQSDGGSIAYADSSIQWIFTQRR